MESILINEAEKNTVKNDFVNKINEWCEMYARQHNMPENQMCQIAVQVFGDSLSHGWIYKNIDQKFKIAYKSESAKHKKIDPSKKKEKLVKFAKAMGFEIVKAVHETSSPLYETIIFQTTEG